MAAGHVILKVTDAVFADGVAEGDGPAGMAGEPLEPPPEQAAVASTATLAARDTDRRAPVEKTPRTDLIASSLILGRCSCLFRVPAPALLCPNQYTNRAIDPVPGSQNQREPSDATAIPVGP